MTAKKWILPAGLAAGLVFLLGSKSAKASQPNLKSPAPPPKPKVPTGPAASGTAVLPVAETEEQEAAATDALVASQERNWQRAAAQALLSGDAPTIDRVADEMERDGLGGQAESLRAAADRLRALAAERTNAEREQTGEPPVTADDIKAAEPAPVPDPPNPGLAIAQELADYLSTTSRYHESRDKVAVWQEELGLEADGMYGPGTALELASYGIVPPRVFYWPPKNTMSYVGDYKAAMLDYAESDPARASQWKKAASEAGL